MPILDFNVSEAGLIIPVLIARVSFEDSKSPKEQPDKYVEGKALVDTGASHTAIRNEVANKLQLASIGKVPIITPNAESISHVYFIKVIVGRKAIPTMVSGLPLENQPGIDCLIGRNILEKWTLSYKGPIGQFTIEF